jgi:hypothetical protein
MLTGGANLSVDSGLTGMAIAWGKNEKTKKNTRLMCH